MEENKSNRHICACWSGHLYLHHSDYISHHPPHRNRNKIAKYKAAAMKPEAEELQVIVTEVRGQRTNSEVKPVNSTSVQVSMSQSEIPVSQAKPLQDNGEVVGLKPGDIVVTWNDGNVSSLYPEPEGEVEVLAEVEKEEVLKKEEVVEVVEEVEKEEAAEGVVVEGGRREI